ncbi:A/G-specific adenine glycosylase [Methylosinus sp. LW4]|uniref:A/G-specific adenine glycosylase n=1 Tax=Methylosinus sp. LW4 TaxID=136993 RepID=UPI000376CCAF|nr:A/G-specific adenine glycosylase [Methylosinus sp. LW4]
MPRAPAKSSAARSSTKSPPRPDPRALLSDLLSWYDRRRRDLPWRAAPGERADPYAVWLSEIMLQQTTVEAVKPYFLGFLTRWPSVEALAAAPLEEVMKAWAGLGYYARARNLHACAQQVAFERGGVFPREEGDLLSLPGVGPYTAAAVAAIAFDAPCVAVDGNVERVVARLFAIDRPIREAKRELRETAQTLLPAARSGDFTQALMDLGATVCTPRGPRCDLCPFASGCEAARRGETERFPVKAQKLEKPLRRGAAFVLTCGGAALLRTRPPRGLLGGMSEFPSTPFRVDFDPSRAQAHAPAAARWRALPGEVEHVFTHFSLRLTIFAATLPAPPPHIENGRWTPLARLSEEGLPTLMRKVAVRAGLIVE